MTPEREAKFKEAEEFSAILQNAYLEAVKSGVVTINGCGHSCGQDFKKHLKQEWGIFFDLFSPDNKFKWICYGMKEIQIEFLEGIGKILDPISIGESDCEWCGERLIWKVDGKSIYPTCFVKGEIDEKSHFIPATCKYAKSGPPAYLKNKISVPSGKLVVGNSLHQIFDDKIIFGNDGKDVWKHEFGIGYVDGQINYCNEYAKHGLLTGFLGGGNVELYADNQSLSVFRGFSNSSILKHIASMCLELRWYGVADYDLCMKLNPLETAKAVELTEEMQDVSYGHTFHNHEYFILNVDSGEYEMIHNMGKINKCVAGKQSIIKKVK